MVDIKLLEWFLRGMLGFRMRLKEFINTWYNIKKPVLSDYFVLKVFKSMILDLESVYST